MGLEVFDHDHQVQASLLESSLSSPSSDRTGNTWTAVAHIITGVIGSGVLTLAWSMAQLGWGAGPLVMVLFALVALVSAVCISHCYRSPDPESGPDRNPSYPEAVRMILGRKNAAFCSAILQFNFFKVGVIYTIASAVSMRAILKSNCFHKEGHQAACEYGISSYMLLFGIIQAAMSQMPNFHSIEWLSVVSAIMSFSYATIGSALGLAKVIGDGRIRGSIGGAAASTTTQKLWLVSQALGDIAFSLTFSTILLNIQDTLKSPPAERVTMQKASTISICIVTFFYLCCGGLGYAAFGNTAPGNLLTGFGFYEPYWLIDFANACIILHLVGAYQVYSQPLFADLEGWIAEKLPNSEFMNTDHIMKPPLLPVFRLNLLRLCFRTAYVGLTTGTALAFPYFNQVVGVAGALTFWPLVIYFPTEMYILQRDIRAWASKWILFRIYAAICLLVALLAVVGSVEGLIKAKFGQGTVSSVPALRRNSL